MRILCARDVVLWYRGPVGEHLPLLDRTLEMLEACAPASPLLSEGLEIRGLARGATGHLAAGLADCERAIELAREHGDPRTLARSLLRGSWAFGRVRQGERALELTEEGLAVIAANDDPRLRAQLLASRSLLLQHRGELDASEHELRRALAIHEDEGHLSAIGGSLFQLCALARDRGQFDECIEAANRSLAIQRQLGNRYLEGLLHTSLGLAHHASGRLREAREHYAEAIARADLVGERVVHGIALSFDGVAAFEEGDIARCRTRFATGRRVLDETGALRHVALFDAMDAAIAASLGEHDAAEARLSRLEGNPAAGEPVVAEVRALAERLWVLAKAEDEAARTAARSEARSPSRRRAGGVDRLAHRGPTRPSLPRGHGRIR